MILTVHSPLGSEIPIPQTPSRTFPSRAQPPSWRSGGLVRSFGVAPEDDLLTRLGALGPSRVEQVPPVPPRDGATDLATSVSGDCGVTETLVFTLPKTPKWSGVRLPATCLDMSFGLATMAGGWSLYGGISIPPIRS